MRLCLTCIAAFIWIAGQPTTGAALPKVQLELIAEGLNAPIFLVEPPDGSGRRIIGEQMGVAYVLGADGSLQKQPFLDLRNKIVPLLQAFDERGLLALALMVPLAVACTPRVALEAPKEPITINLNVKIDHEIRLKVEKDIDDLFSEDSELF